MYTIFLFETRDQRWSLLGCKPYARSMYFDMTYLAFDGQFPYKDKWVRIVSENEIYCSSNNVIKSATSELCDPQQKWEIKTF